MGITQKEILLRLKQFAKEKNLNQAKISKNLRLTGSALSTIFTGKSKLTPQFAMLLELKYNINPEWLLEGKEPMYLPANLNAFPKRTGDLVRSFEKLPEKYQEEVKYLVQELEMRHKREMKKREREREKVRRMLDDKEDDEVVEISLIGETANKLYKK